MNNRILGTIALVLLLSPAAMAIAADPAAVPDFDAAPRASGAVDAAGAIGVIRLAAGSVELLASDGKRYTVSSGTPLRAGDAVRTGSGRARLDLNSGDIVNLASVTTVRVDSPTAGPRVSLWAGRAMAYALPGITGRSDTLALETALGRLSMRAGKALVEVQPSGTGALVFDGRALWQPAAGGSAKLLGSGQGVTDHPDTLTAQRFAQDAEARATQECTPSLPALQEALAAYTAQDKGRSQALFEAVQTAYPFDPTAAYYLGLMAVEQHRNRAAAQQFTTVTQANPEFAAKNELPQHITLLVTQAMGEEVKAALAEEQSIGKQPPEPNSVAVQPFSNQGDEKYRVLSKGLTAMVVSDLSKVPNLKVLERQKLQKLEDELKLSQSGLVDKDTAVRVGRLMKSEKMLLGDYLIGVRP